MTERTLTPKMIISSNEMTEFRDQVKTRESDQFFAIKNIKGKVDALMTSLVMTEAAMGIMFDAQTSDPDTLVFNARSPKIYPTAVSDEEKAEALSAFGTISAYRTNTIPVFVTEAGSLREGLSVLRDSNVAFEMSAGDDTTEADSISDNNPVYAFSSDIPYMVSFLKNSEPALDNADVNITIEKDSGKFQVNAVRFIPMPSVGMVTLNNIVYDNINPLLLSNDDNFPAVTVPTLSRTKSQYLHFKPFEAQTMTFSTMTDVDVEQGADTVKIIGVSKILGEFNTYAAASYVGFAVDTVRMIKNIIFNMGNDGMDPADITAYLYNNEAAFNALSESPEDCTIYTNNNADIDITPVDGHLWLLIKIESEGDSTPVLESISLELGA